MGSGGAAGQWIVGAQLIWLQIGRGATAVAEDQTGGWARPPPGSGYGWSGTAAVAEDQTGGGVRTPFYGEFLRAAKAVWLLHLLAFALEPPPSHFEAGRGAEFHPEYMESVAGSAPRGGGMVVGFAVAPGFKLCNAAVVRARVYLVPRGSRQ